MFVSFNCFQILVFVLFGPKANFYKRFLNKNSSYFIIERKEKIGYLGIDCFNIIDTCEGSLQYIVSII